MRLYALLSSTVLIALSGWGCSGPEPEPESTDTSNVDCPSGKCDGISDDIQDLYSDMRRLNLDDLVSLGSGLATDQLNDALSTLPYVDLQLSPTALFGPEKRELFDQVMIEDLQELQTGLTQRLGEQAFATQINQLRLNTLSATPGSVFAESSFKIGANLQHQWSLDHGDTLGDLGFSANPTLEAIVIAPYSNVTEAVYQNPLASLRETRGFILPKTDEEILQMAPGSSIALKGSGALGFNLGVGAPLIAGAMANYLTLSVRLSAGARVSLQGDLDVQLIRGEGSDVFVDVGLSRQQIRHFSLALESGWGVEGLPVFELDVAGVNVDLTKILENALEKQLNQHLSPFDLRSSEDSSEGRLTVARFHFDLSRTSASVSQALHQSLRGDIRLAQALSNRDNSGVDQYVDLSKEYKSENDYLGFRFLSMRFFKSESINQGIVHIDEGGSNQQLLFDEIEQKGGLFFTERGATWRQLTSIQSVNHEVINTQNNARLILLERDRFLSKDQILDHVDPLLSYFLGFNGVYDGVSVQSDALFKYADHSCGYPPHGNDPQDRSAQRRYDDCVARLAEDPDYRALWDASYNRAADFEGRWRDHDFDENFNSVAEITRRLLDLKVGLSGIHDRPNASLDGPKGSLISQIRFSEEALLNIMSEEAPARFKIALEEILTMMHSDRDDDMDDKIDEMTDFIEGRQRFIKPILAAYTALSTRFDQYHRVSDLKFGVEKRIGDQANLLIIPVNDPNKSRVSSIARLKGELVRDLFLNLSEASSSLREPDHFVLGYALLALTQPDQIELMVNYQFDADHEGNYSQYDTSLYSRGNASFINAGQFNLDDILKAQ